MKELRLLKARTLDGQRQTPAGPCDPITLFLKRTIDILLSIFLILLLWPLILTVAVVIKLSGPGPVFYRGIRTGLSGKPFRIFKFRTMVQNAEKLGGPTTGTNDKRVTKIGRLLRKTKLDELPQLFNVLLGDMSLVGPRPEVLEYTALYNEDERIILSMRPGITDYASIEFADLDDRVGSTDPDRYFRERIMPRKTQLRMKYVLEWSLWEDVKILWMTLARVGKRIVDK